jgi:indole-3-glycerol phosphate synthase
VPGLLGEILAAARRDLAVRQARLPVSEVERRSRRSNPRGDRFVAEISRAGRLNVIAECKRRSPSRGVLRESYEPWRIARDYENAGASAISVVTEPRFFGGRWSASRGPARGRSRSFAGTSSWTSTRLLEALAAG